MDISSIEAQYSDQTIMDIYSDFDIQPQTMNIDNFDDIDISMPRPISETALSSSSEMVVPISKYKYMPQFETQSALSVGLNQNYNKPVTHLYYDLVNLQYTYDSPIIHSSSMDFNLDITDQIGHTSILEEHVASKIDSQATTISELAESLHAPAEKHTYYYSIPENVSATENISATGIQTPARIDSICGIYHHFEDYVEMETGMRAEVSTEFASSLFSSSFSPAIKLSESLKLMCPLHNSNITSGSFDHNGGVLINENDMKITIPRGAIRDGDIVNFQIAMGLYGPYVLPSNCQDNLASPYYWVGISGSYNFQIPVQVEFQHYGACNPSHYLLLCCEDDDEYYTVRPVDYELSFKVQDNISWCTFETKHFCSYCLYHNCRDPMLNRICALYLKPANFQCLNHFKVEIWFTFPITYCLERNKELYTKKGLILDGERSFEASTHIHSTSYFSLSHMLKKDGWSLYHFPFSEILTSAVNFYNFYANMGDLMRSEENSQFPPCFIVNVARDYNSKCCMRLDADIKITLDNKNSEEFKLFVPLSIVVMADCSNLCDKNIVTFCKLMDYIRRISPNWDDVALKLGLPEWEVEIIDFRYNHPNDVVEKCKAMFKYWMRAIKPASWCRLVQALCAVGLHSDELHKVAEEITAVHIQNVHYSASQRALPDGDQGTSEDKEEILNLRKFTKLLPRRRALRIRVIKNVRLLIRNGGSKTKMMSTIGNSFLKVKNPSWTKVHRALKRSKIL